MMMWLIGVCIASSLFLIQLWLSNRNLPPGPWGIPIFGYILWLNPSKPYETFTELSRKYGSVYSIQLGKHFAVVLSDPSILRAALAHNDLKDRTNFEVINKVMEKHGIIFAQGELWKEQRQFICKWLKTIGMSKFGDKKNDLQMLIVESVTLLISELRESNGEPINTASLMLIYTGHVFNRIVLGQNWPVDHPSWTYLRFLAADGTKKFAIATPMSVLPFLKIVPKYRKIMADVVQGAKNTHLIYQRLMDKRINDLDGSEDLMAAFMKEMKKKENDDKLNFFSKKQCHHLLSDLLGAGVDTTANSLRWFLLYMALNKPIQNELYNVLDRVCTNNEILDLEKVENVVLLKSCVYESMRMRPVAPSGIPRATTQETTISGYRIPKGTMIVPLQWAMHYDEKYWTNPHVYDPTRFFDADGNIVTNKAYMPFQAGKRVCVGEMLAYWMLFLFGGNIIHKFDVSVDNKLSEEQLNTIMDGEFHIILEPGEHNLTFKSRHNPKHIA
ncbi:cytochrome P450 306a1-like [Adelges cooleyi]|uniref:cytochrome P450 306a1-like n=1 Tax=Adelges cooleyi TaxID=133065 RepID=UPI00217F9007|nr:cytochrome P450 306a1-like [Adelges cooleyi]XP_050436080.1 cytochrome P450 306a1-like [Adelges cooleyi]